MVRKAREAGFGDVSERLVTDWQTWGLLDLPERIGRGKGGGRGALYEWSDTQLDLFLALLAKRAEVKRVAGLCVIPVSVWLYWGDEFIPLRQVRLALRTWWDAAGELGRVGRSERAARTVVNAFAPGNRGLTVKSKLRDTLAESIRIGQFDVDVVGPLVDQLLGQTQGGTWGPFAHTPGEVVTALRAMTVAMNHYDEISDACFVDVRARQRFAILSYVRDYPNLVRHPTFGGWFEDPNLELLVNQSCHHLLLGLGLALIAAEDGVQLQPVPQLDWKRPPDQLLRLPIRSG